MPTVPVLSIIIPSKNEEKYIENTLKQALKVKNILPTEVIVVDNGSTDNTASIAQGLADQLLNLPSTPISAVRNHGALNANGKVFAFLDADVEITCQWQENIATVVKLLDKEPMAIYGARCHASTNTNFLDKYWFNRLLEYKSDYINSGNLLTSRILFEKIGGFDSSLVTAEDHEFCQRAIKYGAIVEEQRELVALHHGYPSNIKHFVNRERWHGRQDFTTLEKFFKSKVALTATLNTFVLFTLLFIAVVTASYIPLVIYIVFLFSLSIALTHIRYNTSELTVLMYTSTIFAIYVSARSLAMFDQLSILLRRSSSVDT